jgi:cytochrome bd ubiquinol oxidase subunit II
MSVLAFALLAFMLAMYVLTDGYDLGVACVAPFVCRGGRERAATMESIGPFWNGNEVWLIAAGGALFALFPKAYASAFSGFYLPFMVVLWLLMFRGIAMELRGHFTSSVWQDFWDAAFSLSSSLLLLLFGVTIGNLVRGVPLDANGYFSGTFGFLLNPYAVGVGVLAVVALAYHGLLFLMLRIEGPPAERARSLALRLWFGLIAGYIGITIATLFIRANAFEERFTLGLIPIITLGCAFFSRRAIVRGRTAQAFIGSCALLVSLLVAAASTIYPYVLPGYPLRGAGLTIAAASPSALSLMTALGTTILGLLFVITYTTFVAKHMHGKIVIKKD